MPNANGGFRPDKVVKDFRSLIRRYPFRVAKMATAAFEIQNYLKQHSSRYLNIGADGNRPKGWLNVDLYPTFGVVYLDATLMSPLPSESFDAVLCEHMIEHVSRGHAFEICKQIHRVLKPGGVARLVTPDLDRLARLVLQPATEEDRYLQLVRIWSGNPLATSVDSVNILFREYGHQYLYNRAALRNVLVDAGFSNIVETSASGYGNPVFRDAQGHVTSLNTPVGEELNDLEAFAFEAVR
jgi:predicted SAM-dependent methyltransferase